MAVRLEVIGLRGAERAPSIHTPPTVPATNELAAQVGQSGLASRGSAPDRAQRRGQRWVRGRGERAAIACQPAHRHSGHRERLDGARRQRGGHQGFDGVQQLVVVRLGKGDASRLDNCGQLFLDGFCPGLSHHRRRRADVGVTVREVAAGRCAGSVDSMHFKAPSNEA
jgi:hypothetical protein